MTAPTALTITAVPSPHQRDVQELEQWLDRTDISSVLRGRLARALSQIPEERLRTVTVISVSTPLLAELLEIIRRGETDAVGRWIEFLTPAAAEPGVVQGDAA